MTTEIHDHDFIAPEIETEENTFLAARDPDEATIVSTTEKDAFYTKQRILGEDGQWTKAFFGGGVLDKKTGKRRDKRPFQHAAPKVVKLSTVDDIEAMLHGLLEQKKSCVIRGQLKEEFIGAKKTRRTNNARNGVPAYFEAVERTWLMIDIDGDGEMEVLAPAVEGTMAEQATSAAEWAVNEWLPEVFRGCDAVVQWSSSYGLDGRYNRVKAHVWFKLDAPFANKPLERLLLSYLPEVACDGKPYATFNRATTKGEVHKQAMEGDCRLDSCVLRTTQPNFTATPVLRDYLGNMLPDPVAEVRIIRVNKGGPVVSADTLKELATKRVYEVEAAKEKANPKTNAQGDQPAPWNRTEWSKKDESDYEKMIEALDYLGENSPEGFPSRAVMYLDWIHVGMAIHSRFPNEDGFRAWRQWAMYLPNRHEMFARDRWASFHKGGKMKVATIFWKAKERGYGAKPESDADYAVNAPILPEQLAVLERGDVPAKEMSSKCGAAALKLAFNADFLAEAKAYFTYYGKDRLSVFLTSLQEKGCPLTTLKKLAKALTPKVASNVKLPTVDGVEIEFNEVDGFVVSDGGIYNLAWGDDGTQKEIPVLPVPLFVVSADEPLNDDTLAAHRWTLCWRDQASHQWKTRRFDAAVIADKSKIVGPLASAGVPVTSKEAALLVEYIATYRRCNATNIKSVTTTDRMGWQERHGKVLGYMLGTKFIKLDKDAPDIQYQPDTLAAEREASVLNTPAGDFQDWCSLVSQVAHYPVAMSMIYASMAAPLLRVLGVPGFTLDLGGETSTGKTTSLMLAASVWGQSGEGVERTVMQQWRVTSNFVEGRCAVANDLPLLLDDTKQANKQTLADVQYMISNGQAKGRADIQGQARRVASFRKVLISTGENLMLDTNENGGARARVLSTETLPFGEKVEGSSVTGDLTKRIKAVCSTSCYGHLGERLIVGLCDGTFDWSMLVEAHKGYRAELSCDTTGNGVLDRLGNYIAVLRVCGDLLCALTGLDLDVEAHLKVLWSGAKESAVEADPIKRALEQAWQYVIRNEARLEGSADAPKYGEPPMHGWAGKRQKTDGKMVVCLLPNDFEKYLTDLGHNPSATRKSWAARGLLMADSKGKHLLRLVRIGSTHGVPGTPARCYCFDQDAVEKFLGVSGADHDTSSPI